MKLFNYFSSFHKVSSESARLDKFLWKSIGGTWSNAQKLVREGYVLKNGQKIKSGDFKLQRGDEIELTVDINKRQDNHSSQPKSAFEFSLNYQNEIKNQEQAFEFFKKMIIYENDDYIVINKDYGVTSQGGSEKDTNLPNLISNYLIKTGQTQSVFRIVHRLDRPVSGLMFAAKNSNAAKKFSKLLEQREKLSKQYICIVQGIPDRKEGIIDVPLVFNSNKQKAQIANYCDDDHKNSKTEFELLKTNNLYSLIRIKLIDGRKHQIRVHMSKVLNTPIIFDGVYGYNFQLQREIQQKINCPGILLHSWRTTINQGNDLFKNIDLNKINQQAGSMQIDGNNISFQANYPECINEFLNLYML